MTLVARADKASREKKKRKTKTRKWQSELENYNASYDIATLRHDFE
jgi:hypothetical protein